MISPRPFLAFSFVFSLLQDNKAFDLRKFFDYDDATCSSFLKTVLLVDEEEVERSRPKDMLMTLTEKVNIV